MLNVFKRLNNLIQRDNHLKKIILYSFYVSVISFAILLFFAKSNNLNLGTITGDSRVYIRMAENIAYRGIFSNSASAPYVEESFRSPGYSFFMAVLISIFRNWDLALLVQALIVFISPVIFYLIFRDFNEKVAYISSLVFIFEPTKIFLSNIFLSDAIFLVFFLLSIFLFLRWSKSFYLRPLMFSGLILGISTLVRTIAQFLPFVFIVFIIIFSWKKRSFKAIFRDVIVFFLMFFAVIAPWMFRNYIVFGEFSIASLGKFNVAYYNAIGYLKQVHGNDSNEVNAAMKILQTDPGIYGVRSLQNLNRFNQITKDVISNNPLGYAKFHLIKTIPFFFSDGIRDVARYLKII